MANLKSSYAGLDLEQELRDLCRRATPQQALASERKLARMYEISHSTVRRITAKLESEGLLYKIQGRGMFVADLAGVTHDSLHGSILFFDPWDDTENRYHLRLVRGMLHQAAQRQLRVELSDSRLLMDSPERVADILARGQISGLVLPSLTYAVWRILQERAPDLPVVSLLASDFATDMAHVGIDFYDFGLASVRWLSTRTDGPLLCVSTYSMSGDGIRGALARHKCDGSVVDLRQPFDLDNLADRIVDTAPAGLLFDEDVMACDVLDRCRSRGWRADDCTVLSYANIGGPQFPVAVSTMQVDGFQVGALIVDAVTGIRAGTMPRNVSLGIRPVLCEHPAHRR